MQNKLKILLLAIVGAKITIEPANAGPNGDVRARPVADVAARAGLPQLRTVIVAFNVTAYWWLRRLIVIFVSGIDGLYRITV